MIQLVYFIAIAGNRAVAFGSVLVLAYVIAPIEFGVYSLAATTALVVQNLAGNWLATGGGRELALACQDQQRAQATIAVALALMSAGILVVGLPLGLLLLPGRPPFWTVLVLIWACALMLYESSLAALNARHDARSYARLAITRNGVAAALCLLGGFTAGAKGAIAGQILGTLVAIFGLPSSRRLWSNIGIHQARWATVRRMANYGYAATFVAGSYMLVNLTMRMPVAAALGDAAAGRLSLATDLFFVPIALLINTVLLSEIPQLYRASEAGPGKELRALIDNLVDRSLVLVTPYAVGGTLLGRDVLSFVLPGNLGREIAHIAIPSLTFGAAFAFLYAMGAALLYAGARRTLVGISAMSALTSFLVSSAVASQGVAVVLACNAAAVFVAALIALLWLTKQHGRVLATSRRLGILAGAGIMGIVIMGYKSINTVEPLTAVAVGSLAYAAALHLTGTMPLRELLQVSQRPA